MADHDDHDHGAFSELGEMELRVRALQSVLTEKDYIDSAALEVLIDTYHTRIGPRNGARVARCRQGRRFGGGTAPLPAGLGPRRTPHGQPIALVPGDFSAGG